MVSELAAKVPAAGQREALRARSSSRTRCCGASHGAAKRIQQSVIERDGEPRELVEQAERLLFQVAHEEQAGDFREIGEILHDEIDKLESSRQRRPPRSPGRRRASATSTR